MFRGFSTKQLLFNILAWWLGMYFYLLLSIIGYYPHFEGTPIAEYYDSGYIHLEIFLQSFLFGALFSVTNHIAENSFIRRKAFYLVILFKSGFYLLSMAIVGMVVNFLFLWLNIFSWDQIEYISATMDHRLFISVAAYMIIFMILLNGLIEVTRKLGPHEWFNLLVGKYHRPKTEEMIFCFIDLKNSTSIAEQLGHEKYSSLIKDCFHFLNHPIRLTNARVYQYVGDEVVLYWPVKQGLKSNNCIKALFRFADILATKSTFFQSRYDIEPVFKAGMDIGEVTITEVGDIKRELAFHGDVLNSAARLEKLCSKHNASFLISGKLATRVSNLKEYYLVAEGLDELKGLTDLVKVFSVRKNTEREIPQKEKPVTSLQE